MAPIHTGMLKMQRPFKSESSDGLNVHQLTALAWHGFSEISAVGPCTVTARMVGSWCECREEWSKFYGWHKMLRVTCLGTSQVRAVFKLLSSFSGSEVLFVCCGEYKREQAQGLCWVVVQLLGNTTSLTVQRAFAVGCLCAGLAT